MIAFQIRPYVIFCPKASVSALLLLSWQFGLEMSHQVFYNPFELRTWGAVALEANDALVVEYEDRWEGVDLPSLANGTFRLAPVGPGSPI